MSLLVMLELNGATNDNDDNDDNGKTWIEKYVRSFEMFLFLSLFFYVIRDSRLKLHNSRNACHLDI